MVTVGADLQLELLNDALIDTWYFDCLLLIICGLSVKTNLVIGISIIIWAIMGRVSGCCPKMMVKISFSRFVVFILTKFGKRNSRFEFEENILIVKIIFWRCLLTGTLKMQKKIYMQL